MKKLRIKSIIFITCFSIGLAIFIYLFFVPYTYIVNFKTSQSPISVYSFVHENTLDIYEKEKVIYFTQILKNEDTQLHWRVESNNKDLLLLLVRFNPDIKGAPPPLSKGDLRLT